MEFYKETIDLNVSHIKALTSGLLRMFISQLHTDVTFLVGEDGQERVSAHRIVLASQSDYFDCLLYGPMKEGQASEIKLQDTPADAFRELVKFMYSGQISSVNTTTALDLHMLADRFGFSHLKSSIEDRLITIISIDNVLYFHSHALVTSALELQRQCEQFMDQNAKDVIKSQYMLHLPKETLKTLIVRDTFVLEELQIFRTVQKWLEYNMVDQSNAMDLLECVRLSEIPYKELESEVMQSGLYNQQQVSEAMEYIGGNGLVTRGKTGDDLNLFAVSGTKLKTCANYILDIVPEKGDNWSCVSDFIFTLTVPAAQDPAYITVKFDDIYIVNQITFTGHSSEFDSESNRHNSPFCYQVWVSKDGDQWVTILDYSRLKCFSMQKLFFPKMAIRYLRILQTKGREGFKLQLESCSYVGPVPYNFTDLGIIAPFIPMTPAFCQYVRFASTQARLFITFSQPYSINTIRFKIDNLRGNGEVGVSVATQNRTKAYQQVALYNDMDLSSPLEVQFSERPVSIISVSVSYLRLANQKHPPRLLESEIPPFSVHNLTVQAVE